MITPFLSSILKLNLIDRVDIDSSEFSDFFIKISIYK